MEEINVMSSKTSSQAKLKKNSSLIAIATDLSITFNDLNLYHKEKMLNIKKHST